MRPFRALLRRASTQLTPNNAAKTASTVPMLAVTIVVKPLMISAPAVVGNSDIAIFSLVGVRLIFNLGSDF